MTRVISILRGTVRAVFGATIGRLLRPPTYPLVPQPAVPESDAPSVEGITFRAAMVVVGVGLLVVLAYQLRLLLILLFLAVLLAAGLHGVVSTLERWMPRVLAILVAYLGLLGAVSLIMFLIFPPLVREAVSFAERAPQIAGELRAGAVQFIDGVAGQGSGEEIVGTLTAGAGGALPELESLISVPLTFAGIIANTVVVLFLSALLLIERDRIREWAMRFLDEQDRELGLAVGRRALLKLGAYVRGQLLVMTVIGIGSAFGMLVVGLITTGSPLPFAVPLGTLSFATAAIPLAGAFIGGAPIILIALTVSPLAALLMVAWLVVLQQLEGSVITPIVQGRAVALSAVTVLLGVLAGTTLAGIVGGIIAIPAVAVADVVLRDVFFPLRERASQRRMRAASEARTAPVR